MYKQILVIKPPESCTWVTCTGGPTSALYIVHIYKNTFPVWNFFPFAKTGHRQPKTQNRSSPSSWTKTNTIKACCSPWPPLNCAENMHAAHMLSSRALSFLPPTAHALEITCSLALFSCMPPRMGMDFFINNQSKWQVINLALHTHPAVFQIYRRT